MTADFLAMPVAPPEWRHSGPYLIIALALHALVLLLTPRFAPEETGTQTAQPITVTFEQPAALIIPATPPPPPAVGAPKTLQVSEKRRQPPVPPRAMLAVVAQPEAKPSAFSIAESAAPAVAERPASSPPAVAGNAVAPVSAGRYDAAYLENPRPAYPLLSRRLGEEGRVLLRVRVAADGRPVAVDVDRSSNFERLDEAARRAVARWRFVPARRGDEPVEGTVSVPVVFRLDD